jgi:hypothetical protein
VPTPPLRVPGYDTSGTYPQVKGRNVDLRAVNAALRAAVLADQRAYTPYARRERKSLERNHRPVGDWRGSIGRRSTARSFPRARWS